jgi:cytoskeletal protein RodZ
MIGRRSAPSAEPTEKPKGFDAFDLRLGDIMRGERATLGKSLLDVQRELKIKATYIAAIENSDPTVFETPGFIAGYVRSYARYLGLDPEWAYATFCREGNFAIAHGMSAAASGVKAPRFEPKKIKPGADMFETPKTPFVPNTESLFSRIEPGALGSSLVLVALIGFIGYGGWSILQEVQRVQFTPVDQTPGVSSDVSDLGTGSNLTVAENSDALGLQPSADALDRLYRPQALDVPILISRDGPIAAINPGPFGVPGQPAVVPAVVPAETLVADRVDLPETVDPLAVQVVAADAPEVVMFAVRPSWVRVRAADGTVLFEKILDAGEKYALPRTEEPPTLRAGNAGSVYFTVAGQTYGPSGSGPSVVKNVSLAADDLKAAYAVADMTKDRDLAKVVASLETITPAQ